ncbi:hypothetical protein Tcan_11602 [Toxocara canis]|uniref:Uncharacterized protein n=1 Tax=Toxocara canis TaxID=6265 RepID=A0A0B2VUD5_TOXCA|nr:hypothetical protein Tcan_11602 [Toxocara canis]
MHALKTGAVQSQNLLAVHASRLAQKKNDNVRLFISVEELGGCAQQRLENGVDLLAVHASRLAQKKNDNVRLFISVEELGGCAQQRLEIGVESVIGVLDELSTGGVPCGN